MTRSSIEVAKVTPAALIACRSIGASSQRPRRIAATLLVCWQGLRPARRRARRRPAQGRRGVGLLAQIAHRRKRRDDVDQPFGAHRDDRGAVQFRPPDPASQRAGIAVGRQRGLVGEIQVQSRHGEARRSSTPRRSREGLTLARHLISVWHASWKVILGSARLEAAKRGVPGDERNRGATKLQSRPRL